MSATDRRIPSPEPNVETLAYWDAAKSGKLLLKRCTGCGEAFHYPRSICPFCDSDATVWSDASGAGTVFSYSVMRRAEPPYCIAFITLAEGVTMMSNIVDTDLDSVCIGDAVHVVFKPSADGQPVPMFTKSQKEQP